MQKIKYYLMRHAEYYDKDNQFITYKGVTDLKKSVDTLGQDLLIDFIGDIWETQRVRIIHSSLPRAVHTALLVKEILYNISIVARLKPDSNLNSDRLCLTKEYVENIIAQCDRDNEICIFITHEPDIDFFCQQRLQNSEFISLNVEFNTEDSNLKNNNGTDELPF